MSGILTGAVLQRGPEVLRPRMVLVAITEAADDHGFACLSMETIAMKAVCEARTARRVVARLEREGWLLVVRKATSDGKGNVYFVDIARLGVELNPKSRKNDWHLAFERKYPKARSARVHESEDIQSPNGDVTPMSATPVEPPEDILSLEFGDVEESDGSEDMLSPEPDGGESDSEDISGGFRGHFGGGSEDISAIPILKNRVNRSRVPSRGKRSKAADPRHVLFKLACETYAKFKGVRLVWDGSEAGALALLLRASPELTLREFQICLNHRAQSSGTPHGERPRTWLATITRYQHGPLNRFNRTEESNGRNLGNRKADAANESLARAQASVVAEDHADEQAGFDVPGPGRGDGRGSLAELLESA